MIWLLTGPSSSGKSTLAFGPHRGTVVGAQAHARVVFPATLDLSSLPTDEDVVYHYNILRPADAAWSRGLPPTSNGHLDFRSDPSWSQLRELRHLMRAVVLVVSRQTLIARMSGRHAIEPALDGDHAHYPRERWKCIAAQIDIALLYQRWCAELQATGIEFSLVDSSDFAYRPMSLGDLERRDLNACGPLDPALPRTKPGRSAACGR